MKKMFTIIMSVVMMLMVADVRLTANAAEVAASTVESVADVNGDGDVNTKDAEVIVDDIIHNPNTQYCVADWVRVSKIVEEKIGPAICGYDIRTTNLFSMSLPQPQTWKSRWMKMA